MIDAERAQQMTTKATLNPTERNVTADQGDLPEYEAPPVVEVALSVHFQQLPIRAAQVGRFWENFKEDFPETQDQPLLQAVTEKFGEPWKSTAEIQISTAPPLPRCWFVSKDENQLMQLQNNMFVHNWRKIPEQEPYPRYHNISESFERELNALLSFIEEEKIGEFVPLQCEVTYVNIIQKSGVWTDHSELSEVLTVYRQNYSDDFLQKAENVTLNIRYVIPDDEGNPIGRLHITGSPVFNSDTREPQMLLKLVARGRPIGKGLEGVVAFHDIGRKYIVRGFTSITTKKMHEVWRRTR